MNPLTQQGMAALQSGNKAEARRLLKQALQQDSKDIQAWLCLSAAVEGDADIAYCLNMVLRLDPNNVTARQGMARFNQGARSTSPAGTPAAATTEPPTQPDFRAQLLHTPPFSSEDLEQPEPVSLARENVTGSPVVEQPRTPQPARKSVRPKTTRKSSRRKGTKSGFQPWMWVVLGGMGLLICLALITFAALLQGAPKTSRVSPVSIARKNEQGQLPTATPTPGLPPTFTPTASPTTRPTRTPMPTATFIVPGPIVEAQLADIRQQVSSLRVLPILNDVPGYMVTQNQAAELLSGLYFQNAAAETLENEKRSLVALGLIPPSYDLVHVALNQFVDNIGGFYLPGQKQLFILGVMRFDGVERTVYAHEFNHALVDQSYDIQKLQDCPADTQRCQATRALIEGDATLLMNQWLKQRAAKADYDDFVYFQPPTMALADDVPPTYLVEEMNFPYTRGLKFVESLHKRGKWEAVNAAYANPPSSTEQILHPEKYAAGEGPIPVFAPAVENDLGGDWQIIANTSLGEWTTYLLLASGAEEPARINSNVAAKAAAGWGGDHYQVYWSPSLNKSALAAWWAWDSEKDGKEFNDALKKHLSALYNGNTKEQAGADCWENNAQAACIITRPGHTLWLTAPDLPTLMTMWGSYADFQ